MYSISYSQICTFEFRSRVIQVAMAFPRMYIAHLSCLLTPSNSHFQPYLVQSSSLCCTLTKSLVSTTSLLNSHHPFISGALRRSGEALRRASPPPRGALAHAGEVQLRDAPHHEVEGLGAVAAVAHDLGAVLEGQLVGGAAEGAVAGHGGGGHGEAHVLGPVDELEDRRVALVVRRLGLRPQHARVAARPL